MKMEVLTYIVELIPTVGFPIACVIAMAAFIFYVYKRQAEENKANIQSIQSTSKEREDKLYIEIKENREINAKAIETIAKYSEKLDVIQNDVNEIKTDITIITERLN